MLSGSRRLPEALDRLAERLRSQPGHVGLIVALGANSPEIVTAVTALTSGSHAVGYGIVLGSNLLNVALLLGLPALVAGSIELRRETVAVHGAVALATTLTAGLLIIGLIGPWAAAILVAGVFGPYVVLLGLRPEQLGRLPFSDALRMALLEVELEEGEREKAEQAGAFGWVAIARGIVPALLAVVGGSVALLHGALSVFGRLRVPEILTGVLILAFLSSLPNLTAALRLALARRGREVMSEALNSNTLNVVVGIVLPALVLGASRSGDRVRNDVFWLLGLTILALVLALRRHGLGRPAGIVLLVGYGAFVAVRVTAA